MSSGEALKVMEEKYGYEVMRALAFCEKLKPGWLMAIMRQSGWEPSPSYLSSAIEVFYDHMADQLTEMSPTKKYSTHAPERLLSKLKTLDLALVHLRRIEEKAEEARAELARQEVEDEAEYALPNRQICAARDSHRENGCLLINIADESNLREICDLLKVTQPRLTFVARSTRVALNSWVRSQDAVQAAGQLEARGIDFTFGTLRTSDTLENEEIREAFRRVGVKVRFLTDPPQ